MALSKQQIRTLIGSIVLVGFFSMIGILIFVPIPVSNGDIIKILIGFLGGMGASVIGHYFGTSEG
jgi:hypothetical protein